MTDLAGFLLARLAEDEAAARAAFEVVGDAEWIGSHESGHPWRYVELGSGVYAYNKGVASGAELVAECSAEEQSHIARHDPARVLAEVAAKRRIVTAYKSAVLDEGLWKKHPDSHAYHQAVARVSAWTFALQQLAQPYADHPDFDPAWRAEP